MKDMPSTRVWVQALLLSSIVAGVTVAAGPCCWFRPDDCDEAACNEGDWLTPEQQVPTRAAGGVEVALAPGITTETTGPQ